MKPAAEKMKDKINNIKFNKPIFPIINNVTATEETRPEIFQKIC